MALDYEYSIRGTYRNPTQVLNIEQVVKYVVEKRLEGAVVETGVFTGGASAYMLRSLMRRTKKTSLLFTYWGFDSFEGMPAPTDEDGLHAKNWLYGKGNLKRPIEKGTLVGHDTNVASYQACLSYLMDSGYPTDRINLLKGWFQQTIPETKHKIGPIVILRLDGDFYESTKIVLEELYDQVLPGGAIIIDDYGDFQGCRKAVDDFLSERNIITYLYYVDHTTRFFVKPN